jgi:hypothetical protein
LATRASRNVNRLAEFVLTDPSGKAIQQAALHEAIHLHIDHCHATGRHAGIVAPYGHGKTEQVTILRVLQAVGQNPNTRVKVVCNNDDNATARVEAIQQYISQSTALRLVYPNLRPDQKHWGRHSFRVQRDAVSKDATVEAWGVFSGGIGSRSDFMVFDDVCDLKDIWEPSLRQKKTQAFGTQWMSRLVPGAKAVYVATAYHEHDTTHQLLRNPQWSFLWMSVSDDLTGIDCVLHNSSPEHPLRSLAGATEGEAGQVRFTIQGWFTPAELASRRVADPRAFDRGYRNRAITEGELWFPSFLACCQVGRPADHVGADWLKFTGVDLSSDVRAGNVIFTIAVDPQSRRRIPVDIRRGKWSSPQLAAEIVAVNRDWRPQRVMVENNGYQQSLTDWMRSSGLATADVPLQSFTTGSNKHADQTGVRSLEAEFAQGHWLWLRPHEDPQCICAWCATHEEFRQAPLGATNDGVMAAWFAREAARQGENRAASIRIPPPAPSTHRPGTLLRAEGGPERRPGGGLVFRRGR